MPTNVRPEELNYDHYEMEKYDRQIISSIPGHQELHDCIDAIVARDFSRKSAKILELGVGTGLTAERMLRKLPGANYTVVDFSDTMLAGAKKRLSGYNVHFINGDYAKTDLPQENDMVVSVIGIHHQETDEDKKRLFQRIYDSIRANGALLFGDLVTYRDPVEAAVNEARHFHHLVEHAEDEQSLREWAHHHKFLNRLAPLEDQVEWLQDAGFKSVEVAHKKFNTALIYAKK